MPKLDLRKVAGAAFTGGCETLARFMVDRRGIEICAVAFDCNVEEGDLLLSVNTSAHLAAKQKADPADAHRYVLAIGDYAFTGFDAGAYAGAGWAAVHRAIKRIARTCSKAEDDGDEAAWTPLYRLREQVLEAVCAGLVMMENSGAFAGLRRAKKFVTIVLDHDEVDTTAAKRMTRIRKRIKTKRPLPPALRKALQPPKAFAKPTPFEVELVTGVRKLVDSFVAKHPDTSVTTFALDLDTDWLGADASIHVALDAHREQPRLGPAWAKLVAQRKAIAKTAARADAQLERKGTDAASDAIASGRNWKAMQKHNDTLEELVARALVRIEATGELAPLARSDDFAVTAGGIADVTLAKLRAAFKR